MSLSCTIYNIFSLICQHLKRSCDPEHITFRGLSHTTLVLTTINLLPNFKCHVSPVTEDWKRKSVIWGDYGHSESWQYHCFGRSVTYLLFTFYSNYVAIFHRFRDIAGYLWCVACTWHTCWGDLVAIYHQDVGQCPLAAVWRCLRGDMFSHFSWNFGL